jgi:hypothetical protein
VDAVIDQLIHECGISKEDEIMNYDSFGGNSIFLEYYSFS